MMPEALPIFPGSWAIPVLLPACGNACATFWRSPAIPFGWRKNEAGAIAGWIHVFVKQLLESDREIEIGGLVVDQNSRRQGAGKALVEHAERWARSKRLKTVYVRSNVIRKEAHIFYQKLGYKIIKTQSAFRKVLC